MISTRGIGRAGRLAWAGAVALLVLPRPGAVALEPPVLVPAPREVKWMTGSPAILPAGSVAIVLGEQATDPERQGARLLQEFVAKRFGQQWPILREGQEQAEHTTLVILGQPTTCRSLDDLCRRQGLELNETSPGHDGYVVATVKEGARLLVLVGGCNARGVEYGQDTLSQMLSDWNGRLTLACGTMRDVPAIPWRGRPQTAVRHYLRPGELDLYVASRVNFIDLRGGIYAFEPGEKLDENEIAEAVKEAHLRGLIVYGTVNCGVPSKDYDKVLGTFQQLLALGADGLWLSFDDKGPGEDPVALVNRVLDLGRPRQIAGHLIAVTPPKGSYQKIATDFNRKIITIPGMERAIWFWTGVPSTQALEEARAIGLKAKPGWWHNWPRLFTSHAYTGIPPLALGWHSADYETLAEAGECLAAAMPWGGNAFGQHYIVPTINWWAWNPANHEWSAVRRRIYGMVFGPGQADTARRFDDTLQEIFARFRYSYKATDDLPFCPPRLRDSSARRAGSELISKASALLDELTARSSDRTLLTAAELKSAYLDRMRRELETHRAAVDLACPEDWWPEHQRRILEALYRGEETTLGPLLAAGRDRVLRELSQIEEKLPSYDHIKDYLAWWRKRSSLDVKGWQALLQARRAALDERIREYDRQIFASGAMLEGLRSPPLEWGIGRWQVSNRVLAMAVPAANEQFWGDWLSGVRDRGGAKVAVFAADRKTPGDIGEFSELPVGVPVSGHRDRLALLVFASCVNKDLFSNTMVKYRWAGYRFLKLTWQDKTLWEADLGRVPERGEWSLVRLPVIPDAMNQLDLRLRVEDRKVSLNNYTICYVGPIRLMEVPD